MTEMIPFPDRTRDVELPRQFDESLPAFLNRVAGPYWQRVRQNLNAWVAEIEDAGARADLIGRLRSEDRRQFRAAFWELYLHASLTRFGWSVELHPQGDGVSRRPDFVARRPDRVMYVEAFVVSEQSDDDVAAENRRNALLQALDELRHPRFFVNVTFERESASTPNASALRQRAAAWLDELDWGAVRQAIDQGGGSEPPELVCEVAGWRLRLEAWPRSAEAVARGVDESLGAILDGGARGVRTTALFRRKLDRKAARYGDLGAPFLLAALLDGLFVDTWSIEQVLLGREAVQLGANDASERGRLVRRRDGFWGLPTRIRRDNVSAAIVGHGVTIANVNNVAPSVWLNPVARHPIGGADLPWGTVEIDPRTSRTQHRPARLAPASLFELPEVWPGPEPAFPE